MGGLFDLPGTDNYYYVSRSTSIHCVQSTMKFNELAILYCLQGVKNVRLMYNFGYWARKGTTKKEPPKYAGIALPCKVWKMWG